MTRIDRRSFLGAGALAAAGLTSCGSFGPRGAFAQLLAETPSVGEGPFFPDELPRDTDNDLLILNDGITPAVGTITHVSGRVLSQAGEPLRNALVELWQADSRGSYLHSDGASDEEEVEDEEVGPAPDATEMDDDVEERPTARRWTTSCRRPCTSNRRRETWWCCDSCTAHPLRRGAHHRASRRGARSEGGLHACPRQSA